MRNGFIIDTLTSVDIQEIVKIGGKVIRVTKVLIIEETLRHHHLEKVYKSYLLSEKYMKTKKND